MKSRINRKGQVAIFIIVALVLVAGIVLVSWLKDKDEPEVEVRECEVDEDCVPEQCCDAYSCVGVSEAVDCSRVDCAPGCWSREDNHTGCRQPDWDRNPYGECKCVNQKCGVELFG